MSQSIETSQSLYDQLVHLQHAPTAFFITWRQGVKLAGIYYFGDGTAESFDDANCLDDLTPNLVRIRNALDVLSSGERTFLAALTSFYNAHDGGKLLSEVGFEGLADLCELDLKRRQIIATLLLNYQGW
ncbi:hypothetical protein ACIPZ8_14860 [Pseudomonas sp. NPDC089422]|uniref:hypothetical protein n=1 Tax=Pseudomonas sp. NPDC089422 TaxID=3364466 RepID=UPI00382A9313